MTNKDFASKLEEIATYMRLTGENDFRAIAFDRAARTIENLNDSAEGKIKDGSITDIKGIGKSIASDLKQYLEAGSIDVLESLKQKVPVELIKWLEISGLGPKNIYKIHNELDITTLDELKENCQNGKIAALSGLGDKSAAKILKSIEWMEQFSERCRLDEAFNIANRFYDSLKEKDGVIQIQIAGSLRRKNETIGDIDILVSAESSKREAIFNHFVTLPSVVEILGKGETKSSVRVSEGRQVDLRIVDNEGFEAALMYFTGSKEHNVVMRQRARDRGLALNEYGLYELDEKGNTNFDKKTATFSESDIYTTLEMQFVPPEMREDHGEFELYSNDSIPPQFVEASQIKGILHAHSKWSDGKYTIKEMADACLERGFAYLGITDHSKTAAYAGGLSEERIYEQWREIDELNKAYQKHGVDFHIFKGIESDILLNGNLDYSNDILSGFDFIIASVHNSLDLPPEKMVERFKKAIDNPYTTLIGHPTGRLLLKREGNPLDINKLIEYATENEVAIEINASPWRLDIDWRYGSKIRASGLMTAICPDAHTIEGIDDFQYGVYIARKAGITAEFIMNCRSAKEVGKLFKKRM